ncbi:UBP-type zinc finger domain-containing protein [Streptomyces sp. NPDC051217]|uniref:UBP-type zinc finger domain-containing protein n=1 Tax=Streptomyces sp. NPDC051217 TaxID=3365644 RepID=UPI0037AE153F
MIVRTNPHPDLVRPATSRALGREECLATHSPWVHLRLCPTCGHDDCCDSSPNRHSHRHVAADGHPIVVSLEPGEDWRWCFVHEAFV